MIESDLLTTGWRLASIALAAPLLCFAATSFHWRPWLTHPRNHHVYLGSLTVVGLIWGMQAGVTAGLALHFSLVPTLTLMHGWRLTMLGLAGVLIVSTLAGHGTLAMVPINLLCAGFVPAATITVIHRCVEARLPNNYFVYFFLTVFAGSAVAFVASGLAKVAVLVTAGAPVTGHVGPEFVIWLPLMSFAEAFLNGMLMAILVVYHPGWVVSFDDRRYLHGH